LLIAANQDSNSIVAFAVDEATGMPRAAGHQAEVPQPVCVRFVPG
jgi:6-phosphogluconolactonase